MLNFVLFQGGNVSKDKEYLSLIFEIFWCLIEWGNLNSSDLFTQAKFLWDTFKKHCGKNQSLIVCCIIVCILFRDKNV